MNFLVVLIIDNPDDCPCILDAWEAIGITGITILESTGLGRIRKALLRDDHPIIPSLRDILSTREVPHRTLFSVVDSQEKVDRMVSEAKRALGDLNAPHTGFLFVTPVLEAHGLGKAPE
jgi:nitrogen regulatory protein P-II 1